MHQRTAVISQELHVKESAIALVKAVEQLLPAPLVLKQQAQPLPTMARVHDNATL
jgi:hypothetical protein